MTDYEAAFRKLADNWHESVQHYEDRIEKLTAALQKIKDLHHGPEDEDVIWIRDDMTYQIVCDTLEAIDPSPQPPSRD